MSKRKNFRYVKARLELPIENVKEILLHQGYCRKSISDDVHVVGDQINSLHEVNDSDHSLIISKLSEIHSLVEKSIFVFGCICVLMCILILI